MSDPVEGPLPVDVQAESSERAGTDATREAERASLEAAMQRFNVNYNPNGGPPQRELPRLISPNYRRTGNPPSLPPRVNGGGPAQGQAQVGGQAHQPGLLQQLPGSRENVLNLADGGVDRLYINSNPDANTKESKYGVFDDLSAEFIDLAVYNPTQTETVFQKMRWVYSGQEPFEDYVHRMGSSVCSLAVGDICLKNTLYQSMSSIYNRHGVIL